MNYANSHPLSPCLVLPYKKKKNKRGRGEKAKAEVGIDIVDLTANFLPWPCPGGSGGKKEKKRGRKGEREKVGEVSKTIAAGQLSRPDPDDPAREFERRLYV